MTDKEKKENIIGASLVAGGMTGIGRGLYNSHDMKDTPEVKFAKPGTGRTLLMGINGQAGSGHIQMARNLQKAIGKDKADVYEVEDFVKDKAVRDKILKHQLAGTGLLKNPDTGKEMLTGWRETVGKLGDKWSPNTGKWVRTNLKDIEYEIGRNLFDKNFDRDKLVNVVNKGNYDRIIATQSRPVDLLAKGLGVKPEFIISDYSNTERWLRPAEQVSKIHIPKYSVKDLEQTKLKTRTREAVNEIKKKFNVIDSIPVGEEFYRKTVPQSKEELGLHPTKKNIFLFGGGGASYVPEATERFAKVLNDRKAADKYQLNVVTGTSEDAYNVVNKLKQKYPNINVLVDKDKPKGKASGFHTKIKSIMEQADLNVIRSGGASLTESMLVNKPYVGYVTDLKNDEIGQQIVDNLNITKSPKVQFTNDASINQLLDQFETNPDKLKTNIKLRNPYKEIIDNPSVLKQDQSIARSRKPMGVYLEMLAHNREVRHARGAKMLRKLRGPGLVGTALLAAGAYPLIKNTINSYNS